MKKKGLLVGGGIAIMLLVMFLSGCKPILLPAVTAIKNSDNTIKVSWNTILSATSYNVYISTNNVAYNLEPSLSGATTTTVTFRPTVVNTYWFKVSAVNSNGEGPQSLATLPITIDTLPTPAP